ncbi:MAG TPA: response regulator [Sphingomicrobium sp.]
MTTIPDGVPVYVIDDDTGMLDSMSFLLGSLGIPSKHFADPFTFLQTLDSLRPGCVLTDLRMPTMTGLELNRELAARKIDWPVVLMSAHLDSEASADARDCGVTDVIQKPFTVARLKAVLGRALSRLSGSIQEVQAD